MKWIDFNNFLDVHGALWANYLVKIQHTKFQIYNLLTNNSVFHYQVVVDFYFSHILVRLNHLSFWKRTSICKFANSGQDVDLYASLERFRICDWFFLLLDLQIFINFLFCFCNVQFLILYFWFLAGSTIWRVDISSPPPCQSSIITAPELTKREKRIQNQGKLNF